MGKRKSTKTLTLIIIIGCLLLTSCISNKARTNEEYIIEWVKNKYGTSANAGINSTLDSSLTDRIVYSGYIIFEGKQMEGIFFYNPENHAVTFNEIK